MPQSGAVLLKSVRNPLLPERVEQVLAGDLRPAINPTWARRFWARFEKTVPHWDRDGHRDRHGVALLNIFVDGKRRPVAELPEPHRGAASVWDGLGAMLGRWRRSRC